MMFDRVRVTLWTLLLLTLELTLPSMTMSLLLAGLLLLVSLPLFNQAA